MIEPKTELTLQEAAEAYAIARAKLPEPGQEFRGPDDAANFNAFSRALFELERAAQRHAIGSWEKAS
jgi:hypothetical protein